MGKVARVMYCRAQNPSDSVVAEKGFPPLGIGYENKFRRPFSRGEDKCGFVGLLVRWN
jgi:hypothetical protein